MEGSSETILKTEGGYVLQQKGSKKHIFNPPTGTLILTDRRFIFAQSDVGLKKRAMAGGLGLVIGSEILKTMSTVKPEELNKAFEMPESFYINLTDIVEAAAKRQLTASGLTIRWNAPEGETKAEFYKTGMITGLGLPQDWVEAINATKQKSAQALWSTNRIVTPQQQYAPPPPQYAPPQQPQYVPPPPPPVQPQAPTRARYCAQCGSAIPAGNRFCQNCGAQVPTDQGVCPSCKNTVPPGSRFCPNCAYQLQ